MFVHDQGQKSEQKHTTTEPFRSSNDGSTDCVSRHEFLVKMALESTLAIERELEKKT